MVAVKLEGEADGGAAARLGVDREEVDPVVLGDKVLDDLKVVDAALDESGHAADRVGPGEGVNVVLDGQHGGGVDGSPGENASVDLALLGHPKNLGKGAVFGHVALEALDGPGGKDEDAMGPLSSEDLLPGVCGDVELLPRHLHGEASGGCVAKGEALPVIANEITSSLDPNTASGTVEGEEDVVLGVHLGQVGKVAIIGSVLVDSHGVLKLEVGDGISEPPLSETLPVANVNVTGAEHVPHSHLVGSSVGSGDNADKVVLRDVEEPLGLVNGVLQGGLADLGCAYGGIWCLCEYTQCDLRPMQPTTDQ